MKIVSSAPEVTFDDVLLLSGRAEFTVQEEQEKVSLKGRISRKITLELPIMSAPMPGISGAAMAIALAESGAIGVLHPFVTFGRQLEEAMEVKARGLRVAAAIMDLSERGFAHVGALHKAGVDLISVESLQAHNTETIDFIRRCKDSYEGIDISVGVVITPEACEDLIDAGADSVRIGIGGGSHCTTRLMTGVGRPQLSAVHACYAVTKERGVPLISDTGIRYPGDLTKAFVFGADAVMIGGLFAGTDECPGDLIVRNGKKYKQSWGMCTVTAIEHKQTYTDHEQPVAADGKLNVFEEGVEGLIPYGGSAKDVAARLAAGVRRAMWYMGSTNLEDLRENAQVVIVSPNTLAENKPRI